MQNALWGWLVRRAGEIGSLITILAPLFMAMPPHYQAVIGEVLSGRGGGLSIATAAGFVWYVVTQWRSLSATIQPQVVTTDGTKIVPKANSVVTQQIDQVAVGVQPQSLKPTIFEQLIGAFRR
jgi:hypothetical protein